MSNRYIFDPAHSQFRVQAFASGMLSAFAHSPTFAVRDFTGEFQFDPASPEATSLHMAVKADSLDLLDDLKAQDRADIETRMRQEVLLTATYPEIRFDGTAASASRIADNWYRLQIEGNLVIRGVSQTQKIDAQLRIGDAEARLSGEFSLAQSAFQIKRVSAVGGMIVLKDELKCSFDLAGQKQDG
jgi:polyisoprenoid-binding protein YceI